MTESDRVTKGSDTTSAEYSFKLARALFAFLALPGMVAFIIPLWISPRHSGRDTIHWLGVPVLVAGILVLLWCVRDFYVAGKGTLAPWSPPKSLVTVGLYRFSRNPMYVGVLTILFGWALWFESSALLLYALAFVAGFHLRVLLYEEPWASRTFGDEWEAYRARVPRWMGMARSPPMKGKSNPSRNDAERI